MKDKLMNQVETFYKIYNELSENPNEWVRFYQSQDRLEIYHGTLHANGIKERAIEIIIIHPDSRVTRSFQL